MKETSIDILFRCQNFFNNISKNYFSLTKEVSAELIATNFYNLFTILNQRDNANISLEDGKAILRKPFQDICENFCFNK